MDLELPQEDKNFILQKALEGWSADIISYELRNSQGSMLTDETVENFLNTDDAEEEIEKLRRIQEKKAEISREDLIRELKDEISHLQEQRNRLEGSNDEISNDTTKNLLKAIRSLADMIDVLESKDGGGADNVVNINKLEQNFDLTQNVKYLPPEDKREIAERLRDDPDVEDFLIMRSDDVEEVVEA